MCVVHNVSCNFYLSIEHNLVVVALIIIIHKLFINKDHKKHCPTIN